MLTKTLLLVLTAVGFAQAAAIDKRAPPPPTVFTATRVYKTITNVAPYIVNATTVITWTPLRRGAIAKSVATAVAGKCRSGTGVELGVVMVQLIAERWLGMQS
ncbi:hypothetical protein FB45DRAFT_869211 [Roridomyces roridus]|uniref:Antifreeze protein n=1 Tax=Roridomyces roridus TaxID=1738132 RepID=A0AAD7BNG9_9AGAR|nr:hypothetical protein FB45DRAFT_869211 [Roridomyces roridus]